MAELDDLLAVALRAADISRDVIMPIYAGPFDVERKADRTPVTEADRRAEIAMREFFARETPGFGVLGEEYGESPGDGRHRWIVDPIDGTKSFMRGVPLYGVLLGLEIEGRPDGMRPQNYESWLEYYEARYKENPDNFSLDPDDCARLRDEAVMYYQRYLSLFTLRDFERVIRDTLRNLRVLDFVKAHADDTGDRLSLEQYRPYLIMMYTRAAAYHCLDRQLRGKALNEVRKGIAAIEEFFREIGREELAARSPELTVLRQLETEIKEQIPEAKIEARITNVRRSCATKSVGLK